MTLALVVLTTAVFLIALHVSGVIGLSTRVVTESGAALKVIGDAALDDNAKELAVQRMAVAMFRLFGKVLVRLLLVLGLPAALIAAALAAGVTDAQGLWHVATSWPFLLAQLAAFTAVVIWR